jgi:HlyD family secretion protein
MMRVVIVVVFVLAATASGAALFVTREPGEAPPRWLPPTVTATAAREREFVDRLFVSGTLVARDEAMVGAQIDGLRIVEVLVEDGDRVEKGQVLARLDRSQLDALLAENDAALARADATIAQARNQLDQAEAIRAQAAADLLRARKLEPGVIAQATLDQRVAAARSTEAQFAADQSALAVASADKRSREAERRELMVRVERTDVRAPVAGFISRRSARLGALAVGSGDPLFRIITDGAIELEADVPEDSLAELAVGMAANVELPGPNNSVNGTVRLISSEVDQTTRLGKVRIALATRAHIGSFASASIILARRTSVAVPAAAVVQTGSGESVLVVHDGHVEQRTVTAGLTNDTETEITVGVGVGEAVVVRAAAFLRNGDAVRAVASGQHREAAK